MKGTFTNTLPVFGGGGMWNLERQVGETMNAFVSEKQKYMSRGKLL